VSEHDRIAGRLLLRPGSERPIECERPMVGTAMMRRLTEGRRASLLPDLMAAAFTLCASTQRDTSRRAVRAALGQVADESERSRDLLALRLFTARDHLQRLALDQPQRMPAGAVDPSWVRDAPVLALPQRPEALGLAQMRDAASALPGWLERRLFGVGAAVWLQRWNDSPEAWLSEWSAAQSHPLARWLCAVRETALAVELPYRPLALLEAGENSLRGLAVQMSNDQDFAEHPTWSGAPAETGPWTRRGRCLPPSAGLSLWHRLGSRLADLAHIALGGDLALGELSLAGGEGLAWSEMSRGLLIHWLRLEPGPQQADTARAAIYRVLAPTEWNFHPQGSLAEALHAGRLDPAQAALAVTALDPCVEFVVQGDA